MKNNFELGVMYDTLRAFEMFYNYEEVIQDLKQRSFDVNEVIKYYKKIENNIDNSPRLHAFLDLNKSDASLLTNLFINKIDNITTIDDFLLLLNNKELILSNIFECYIAEFSRCDKDELIKNYDTDTTLKRIVDLKIDGKIKASLVLILTDYNNCIDLLLQSIGIIYTDIKTICNINKNKLSNFTIKENYLLKLKEILKTEDFDDVICGISLIDSYSIRIINYKYCILGVNYNEALDKRYMFLDVTFESICNIFANKLNNLTIDIIFKHNKVCATDIFKLLPDVYSSSAVYKSVSDLHKLKVLKITDNKNNKIYYSLNNDFVENARIVFNKQIKYYLNEI